MGAARVNLLRFLLRFLSATIIASALGYTVDQFCILWAGIHPIAAQMLGIAVWAGVLLVLMAVMGRQAREWR
jgi:hypothetical protein